jgi:D-sedoheptulose 7-phosphate isomerase
MNSSTGFLNNYLEYLTELISQLDRKAIGNFADLLLQSRDSGSTTFFLGNGGSASTATHFVNDISVGSRQFKKPFRAISLCDNQAVITAIANDDGYENIFLQQLQTLAKPEDTIVCISASGNSKNLIKAIEYAKDNNLYVVGLTAFDGGYLKENCDLNIHVPTKIGEYGPAEDLHMVVCGLIGSYFREKFLND